MYIEYGNLYKKSEKHIQKTLQGIKNIRHDKKSYSTMFIFS